jgi:hypothetical protein
VIDADRKLAEQINRLYAEYDSGQTGALARLCALQDRLSEDVAFVKFCDRLSKTDPGGSYVFESK